MYELNMNECSSVFDIIAYLETWLDDSYAPLCNLPGYNLFHHQCGSRGCSVCIYVKGVFVNVQPIDLHFPPATIFEHCQQKLHKNLTQ